MSKEFNDLDLFDAYHHGELPEKERNEFEQRLISDAEFLKEYQLYIQIEQAIEEIGDETLKRTLQQQHTAYKADRRVQKTKRLLIGFVAIMVALSLVFYFTANHPIRETPVALIQTPIDSVIGQSHKTVDSEENNIITDSATAQKTVLKGPNTSSNTQSAIHFLPIQVVEKPRSKLYYMTFEALHVYGIEIQENAFIIQEETGYYLVNNFISYPITLSPTLKPLESVKKRFHETAIRKKSHQKTPVISHFTLEAASNTDSLELIINPNMDANTYLFEGKKIIVQKWPDEWDIVLFESNYYIRCEKGIQQLVIGKMNNLNFKKDDLFQPTSTELIVIEETVEKKSHLENSH